MKDMELAQLLLAKFCHDIAGSLGAIWSSTEYLEYDNQDTRKKAIKLINDGSHKAISSLKFFRSAYGFLDNAGEANLDEIQALSRDLLYDHKINLDFHRQINHTPEVFICINTGRLILCLTLIASMALLNGGSLNVLIEKQSDAKRIRIKAAGSRIKIDEKRYAILRSEVHEPELSEQNIHYYYTMRLLWRLGLKLKINIAADSVEYIVE